MPQLEIQIVSDLYLDTYPEYDFPIEPKAPNLALLGNIGITNTAEDKINLEVFLMRQCRSFKKVFYVPGTHEVQDSDWNETLSFLRHFEFYVRFSDDAELGEFFVMNRKRFVINDFAILGCRLFSHIPETVMPQAE